MSGSVSWFITGASRGIGFEITRQLVSDASNVVIASCRNPQTAIGLAALEDGNLAGKLHIVKLDVTDENTIKNAAKKAQEILGDEGLDYLLNNAGVNPVDDGAFNFDPSTFSFVMQNNVVGPALVAKSLLPLLKKGNRKVIMNMTSGLASIGLDCGKKCCTYSMSKAAVNMLTYKQAQEEQEIKAICVDPGWVKTEMGGEGATLEPEQSVTPFLAFLKRVTKEHSGGFFNYKGEPRPW